MNEWFDDDSFWIDLYPFMFSEQRWSLAAEEIENLLSLVHYGGDSVLDLCCGPGRHAILLARRGLRVTGVDRTAFLLDLARERARRENVEVEWILSDMREFRRPEAFDLALNLFTSFGYFEDRADDRKVLRNVHASLKPGGILVMDLAGKEWLADGFQPTTSEKRADGSLLVQRHEIIDDWARIHNEWILIRDGSVKTYEFRHRIYSGQELKDLMEQAGFSRIRLYGDFDGSEFGPGAARLVAVALKD